MIICNNRKEWLSARSTGLGASESAAILGVSPWKSALELYYEKRGEAPTPDGETFARTLGLKLEDPIAELYAEKTGRAVERPRAGMFNVQRHDRHLMMLATLDGMQQFRETENDVRMSGARGPLEIKTAAISKAALWTDEPPIDYQVQVQHQLAVTGCEFASIVALIGGVSIKWGDIKRDPEFVAMLEAACEEFWRRIEIGDPPPADGTESTKEFLKRLYAKTQPKEIPLPAELIDYDAQLAAAKDEISRQQKLKLEAENRIKQVLGENVAGRLPNGVVYTWKPQSRQGYTVAPCEFRDFRRHAPKRPRPTRGAPKLEIDELQDRFAADQAAEIEVEFE